ncbi:glycosyltransferase [Streptococcus pseudoporcinus]|uniref:Glycosyl transferase n=1 Tax=Streptococcus pseudoporcinus TaxID=361101 RepID=A0A4U9XKY1_9STRE|nr:glycosyltransferase [Streptococcus pseudoporcinus]VTS13659.1 glycosyl transferase [Streptococcus pseudoporcinus]VUC66721.1 glycosyl transferase [Streptococcus pseudoporcinus]VUC97651.1 glycosyl transferase [Streptococcus pseudoporcinus]VUC98042.1 glycosyl transferase [Streptococcus pseudoporcinus]
MKKILFVSPTGTLDNGAEIAITNLMVFLSENNVRVYNVIPKTEHSTSDHYVQKMEQHNIKLYPLQFKNWWWESAPGVKQGHEEERAVYYQQYIYEIRKIISDEEIDIVISNTVNVFQGAVAAMCEQVKHYWLIHEFPLEEFKYYEDFIPFIENVSDKVFAVQGKLTDYIRAYFSNPDKLESFVPFADLQTELTLKKGSKNRIISISRINENKNQLELLEAYAQLPEPRPDLIFIGDWDKDYKEKCDSFIKNQQLANVSFTGHQDNPWENVQDKDILVLNSKMETFGLVYVEALLQGVPVLTSNNYGYQSVKNYFDFGLTYSLGDINGLVQKLSEMMAHYSDYQKEAKEHIEAIAKKYTRETSYQSIFTAIFDQETAPLGSSSSWLAPLSPLLGAFKPHNMFSPANNKDKITIYYRTDDEAWSEERTLSFTLKETDKFVFSVPDKTVMLRLDMSEIPSYYDSIELTHLETKTELLPNRLTGHESNGSYYFDHLDPQMEYNISFYREKTFHLSYQLANLENYFSESFLPHKLVKKLANLEVKQKDMCLVEIENNSLRERNQVIQEQLEEMVYRYNSVTHSRRWIIPTKIIDFLRRNK